MNQITERGALIPSIVITTVLLSACSSGGSEQPDLGQAVASPSIDISQPSQTTQNVGCAAEPEALQASVLYFINQARSTARMCGNQSFASAPPLVWNDMLQIAAQRHSDDMAQHNFFSHTGSDGSSASQRASDSGFNWRTMGENIAAGQPTSESVVQSWLDSPGHCANLMSSNFEETAVACTQDNQSQYGQYWTNVLGADF